jgi:hypothetical protein
MNLQPRWAIRMPNTFTGTEFLKSLSEESLKEPLVKIGMAKKDDDSEDTVLFAEGGVCEDWISVPVGVIEQVTFLQTVPCRDHRHPLVMIEFKEPEAGDRASTVFAEFARRSRRTAPGPGRVPPGIGGQPSQTVAKPTGGGDWRPKGPWDRGPGDLECIVWHEVCGWTTLYISALGINIPFYYCWNVCDTWGLP